MCLAIPAQVMSVEGTVAIVRVRGAEARADASMVPVRPGDFVLVYAGLIVETLESEEARERLRLLDDVERAGEV